MLVLVQYNTVVAVDKMHTHLANQAVRHRRADDKIADSVDNTIDSH